MVREAETANETASVIDTEALPSLSANNIQGQRQHQRICLSPPFRNDSLVEALTATAQLNTLCLLYIAPSFWDSQSALLALIKSRLDLFSKRAAWIIAQGLGFM